MFCSNCGTKLPNEANYCLNCGSPQKDSLRKSGISVGEPKWETCEIDIEVEKSLFSKKSYYNAKAIGPKGMYSAGRSDPTEHEGYIKTKQNDKVLEELIRRLTAEGWEPLGRAENTYFGYRFRRRVK